MTSVEPPPLGMPLPPMFEESNIEVTVMITETDGTRRTAELEVPDRTEDELAEAILTCVRGVAVMRGPGLTAAIERWIQIMADDATVDRIGGARGYSADAVIIDEPFVDDVKAKPGSYLVLQLLEAWRDELRQDEDLAGEAAIDSASKVIATAMKRRERERAGND